MKKIVGVTGHRVLKHEPDKIKENLICVLNYLKADIVISGMALGFDQLVADTCLELNIKYVAAIPYKGQETRWPPAAQVRYWNLVGKAWKAHVVSDGPYAAWKLHVRNEWIVNKSSVLIAYCEDLTAETGGTVSCIKYAMKKEKNIINIF